MVDNDPEHRKELQLNQRVLGVLGNATPSDKARFLGQSVLDVTQEISDALFGCPSDISVDDATTIALVIEEWQHVNACYSHSRDRECVLQ